MKENDLGWLSDRTETNLYTDITYESKIPMKTYREYWKRAMRKIKIYLMLKKFSASASSKIEIGRPSEIFERFSSLQSSPSDINTPKPCIILPFSKIYLLWITLIGLYVLYLSTYGIFIYSFYKYDSYSKEAIIEATFDVIFFADIFVSFNLAYFSKSNKLVKDRGKVGLHYLKTFFFVDLLMSIPFGIILHKDPSQEFSKIVMFRHLPKLMKWYKVKEGLNNIAFRSRVDYFFILYSNYIQLVKLLACVVLTMHISACLFYLSARADHFDEGSWVYRSNMLDMPIAERYFTSLYWSAVTAFGIGYGDIHPYTNVEKTIAMVWMIISVFIISVTISLSTVVFERLDRKFREVEETLMVAEKMLNLAKIPRLVGKQVLKCIRDQVIITKKVMVGKLLNEVEMDVRYEVAMSIYNSSLSKVHFFTMKSKTFISCFVFMLEFVQYKENEYIWHQKASADGIYFILVGRIKYLYNTILFYVMREGEFFGETELFMNVERKFDAIACELTKCLKMTKESMNYMNDHYPTYYSELKKMRKRRRKNLLDNLTQMTVLHKYYRNEIQHISRQHLKDTKTEIFAALFENDQRVLTKSRISNTKKYLRLTRNSINHLKSLTKSLNPPI